MTVLPVWLRCSKPEHSARLCGRIFWRIHATDKKLKPQALHDIDVRQIGYRALHQGSATSLYGLLKRACITPRRAVESVVARSSRNGPLKPKRQITFAEAETAGKKRVAKRQRFLTEMERLMPPAVEFAYPGLVSSGAIECTVEGPHGWITVRL